MLKKIKYILLLLVTILGSELSFASEVNLYTSRHYDTDDALYEEFTKQTGIKVNVISAKGKALIEKIKSEGERVSS
jgi:iron(III) transport system substrate-binding protein